MNGVAGELLWWPGQRLHTVRVYQAVLPCGCRGADGRHGSRDSLPWPMQLSCLGAFAGIAGLEPLLACCVLMCCSTLLLLLRFTCSEGTAARWPLALCRVWSAQLAAPSLGAAAEALQHLVPVAYY